MVTHWLERFIATRIGTAAPTFAVQGRSFDARSFFATFDPVSQGKLVSLVHPRAELEPDTFTPFYQERRVDLGVIAPVIKAEIDAGRSVYTGLHWKRQLVQYAGVLYTERDRPIYEGSTLHGKHAVAIVGYQLDAEGRIASLKLQNSWGPRYGRDGFAVVAMNDFLDAVRYIQVVE